MLYSVHTVWYRGNTLWIMLHKFICIAHRKGPRLGGFKTDITHDHVLGISVNIPDLRQISHMAVY